MSDSAQGDGAASANDAAASQEGSSTPAEASPRKVSSLKDRIAMFNQPKASGSTPPPPPTKPKAFKWKTSSDDSNSSGSKVLNVSEPPQAAAAAATTPTPSSSSANAGAPLTTVGSTGSTAGTDQGGAPLETVSSRASGISTSNTSMTSEPPAAGVKPPSSNNNDRDANQSSAGMSAADAKASAGSLKDRIAMLSAGAFRVDQPGIPGRPLKPWKKKPQPEQEQEQQTTSGDPPPAAESTTAGGTQELQTGEEAGAGQASPSLGSGTSNPLGLTKTSSSGQGVEGSAAEERGDDLASGTAKDSETSGSAAATMTSPTTSSAPAGGVAMPAMPSRARGPQRKPRAGASASPATPAQTNANAASDASSTISATDAQASSGGAAADGEQRPPSPVVAAVADNKYSPDDGPEARPSLTDIGSPSAGRSIADPVEVAKLPASGEGAEALDLDQPSGPSVPTGQVAGNLPKPPRAAANEEDEDDAKEEEETEEDAEGGKEAAVVASEEEVARQTIEGSSGQPRTVPPSMPTSKRPMPTVPFPVDTSTPSDVTQRAESPSLDSPTSPRLVNRRSMTRPPVPMGFQRTPSLSSSARSSMDLAGPRRSMSIREDEESAQPASATPDDGAGDGEFANPALDSDATKSPVQPPVGKPFDTVIVPAGPASTPSAATEGRGAPGRDDESSKPPAPSRQQSLNTARSPPSRQGSLGGGLVSPPLPGGAMMSPPLSGHAPRRDAEGQEYETNLAAAAAYRQAQMDAAGGAGGEAEEEEEEYEDPEVARRQAIAKRMAAMGGMRLGMLPPMFGGSPKKKKASLPSEEGGAASPTGQAKSPLSEVPPAAESTSATRAPESPASERPPTSPPIRGIPVGGLGLPGLARMPPPPPVPATSAEEGSKAAKQGEDDAEEEDADDDGDDEQVDEDGAEADKTVLPDSTPRIGQGEAGGPPPVPANRPSRPPPPPTTSFIDVDTDTDGGVGSKRTSMQSSNAPSVLPDFPVPPGGSERRRTESGVSAFSEEPTPIAEEPEELEVLAGERVADARATEEEDDGEEDLPPPPPAPSRPSRPAPQLSTGSAALVGEGGRSSYSEYPGSQGSPISARSQSQRSSVDPTAGGPPSPHSNRQSSFSQLSPSPSVSSRRSSTMPLPPPVAGAGQQPPGSGGVPLQQQQQQQSLQQGVQPGLSHQYLQYLAVNAIRTKSRDIDGPLANILHDIAYAQRANPQTFGIPIYRTIVTGEKGRAPDLQIHGRIEAGCIFFAWDAKFDRGLGRSSLKVGSAEVPHIAIVAEDVKDVKKPKVRVVELAQGRHAETIYKLDDLKLGCVDIRRLP